MQEEKKSPAAHNLTTREWILILTLSAAIQFILHCLAWRFENNQNALGYVSFAGTLISIILAVLAIGYGFIQATEQSRSTSTIASQISSLRDVVSSFQSSERALSEQLGQLGTISEGITKAVSATERSQRTVIGDAI